MARSRRMLFLCLVGVTLACSAAEAQERDASPRMAGISTVYRRNSHAEMIIGRLVQGYHLNGRKPYPTLHLASLYTDQVPENDLSRELAGKHGFPVTDTVPEALTLGSDSLAIDGVLLVAEHGEYEKSATGNRKYPKRRLFSEIAGTFESTGEAVPVFIDKHLADNWKDAKWIYDKATELNAPLMAGSSLPVLWRYPPVDTRRDEQLEEIVALSFGSLDGYGFHALEMVQCLAERRSGGETGVRSVRCLTGDSVWEAGEQGLFSQKLFDAAISRLSERRWKKRHRTMKEAVRRPVLWIIDYRDGLRASVLTLNGAVADWTAAWKHADRDEVVSTRFQFQDGRPYGHFTFLVKGIERLMHSGRGPWPVERTLLTSGMLNALLRSQLEDGTVLKTPWLDVQYRSDFDWQQPPPPVDLEKQ